MLDERLIRTIVDEVVAQIQKKHATQGTSEEASKLDITSAESKAIPLLKEPQNPDELLRMKRSTTARIGVGRAGPRLNTQTLLTLRADHAKARDAVLVDVDQKLLERLNLFSLQTCCHDKKEYLTHPDLGRQFSPETLRTMSEKCEHNVDVQIFASNGLSSKAIEANLEKILPVLIEGLQLKGLKVGTPFFVQFGRVGTMEYVSETLGAKVTCILIGERPGLGMAESMSAYIAYNARVGMSEALRTVVSNIHRNGTSAIEAGAYIIELICKMLENKASGIGLKY